MVAATLLYELFGLIECVLAQNVLVELFSWNDENVVEPGSLWLDVLLSQTKENKHSN